MTLGHDTLAALLAPAARGRVRLCDGCACGQPRTQDAPAGDVHERRLRVGGEELLDVDVCARHCAPAGPVQHAFVEDRPCKLPAVLEAKKNKDVNAGRRPTSARQTEPQGRPGVLAPPALSGCEAGKRGGAARAVQQPEQTRANEAWAAPGQSRQRMMPSLRSSTYSGHLHLLCTCRTPRLLSGIKSIGLGLLPDLGYVAEHGRGARAQARARASTRTRSLPMTYVWAPPPAHAGSERRRRLQRLLEPGARDS